jgi:hypothetical protein
MTVSLSNTVFSSSSSGDEITYLNGGNASTNLYPIEDVGTFGSPAPVPGDDGLIPDDEAITDLTPESLMAYCTARLDSLNEQAGTILSQQEQSNSTMSALQGVVQAFQLHSSGVTNDPATCTALETSLNQLISQIKATNPTCPELGKLEQTYNNLLYSGTGPIVDQSDPSKNLDYIDATDHPPDTSSPEGDNTLGDTEVQAFVSNLQGAASDLNSDSQLQMIQLQSLMSQQQTAIELTTNLVQSLGDQSEKIAENVGH